MYVFINTTYNIQLYSLNMDLENIKTAFKILYTTNPEFIGINILEVFDEHGNKIDTFTYVNDEIKVVS